MKSMLVVIISFLTTPAYTCNMKASSRILDGGVIKHEVSTSSQLFTTECYTRRHFKPKRHLLSLKVEVGQSSIEVDSKEDSYSVSQVRSISSGPMYQYLMNDFAFGAYSLINNEYKPVSAGFTIGVRW